MKEKMKKFVERKKEKEQSDIKNDHQFKKYDSLFQIF